MLRRVALVKNQRRNIPEDGILHSHRRENLESYISGNIFVKVVSSFSSQYSGAIQSESRSKRFFIPGT
jgi:hypothetical protein